MNLIISNQHIVWAINDIIRSNEMRMPEVDLKNLCDVNQRLLINLLIEDNINHRFLLIEKYRNRGDFYKANNLLMQVYSRKYMDIKEAFKFFLENKNQKLFEIIL